MPTLPRVTVHNEMSLDGRVTHFTNDASLYYSRALSWRVDAVLMGSRTAFRPDKQDDAWVENKIQKNPIPSGFETLIYEPRPRLVIPDSRGSVWNWLTFRATPWYSEMIALISETTPKSYLDYLESRHVQLVMAGIDRIELHSALEQLNERFVVESILVDSGGSLNGALLRAGLVSEISVILHPTVVSGRATPTLFDSDALPELESNAKLKLTHLERLANDALWLKYFVV